MWSAPHTPPGAAAPELAGLQSACAAEGFPHLLVRVPQTAGGSRPGTRRGQQVMAQLCGQRRGRALLALLASLLLSGAEAAGRDLDFHGEGPAGIPGGRGCAGSRGNPVPRNRRLLGDGDGVLGGAARPAGLGGVERLGTGRSEQRARRCKGNAKCPLGRGIDPERRGAGLSWGRKWMRSSTKRKFEGQRKSTGGSSTSEGGVCLADLLAALGTGKPLPGHLLLGCRATAFRVMSEEKKQWQKGGVLPRYQPGQEHPVGTRVLILAFSSWGWPLQVLVL